jgi:hypothetical protein
MWCCLMSCMIGPKLHAAPHLQHAHQHPYTLLLSSKPHACCAPPCNPHQPSHVRVDTVDCCLPLPAIAPLPRRRRLPPSTSMATHFYPDTTPSKCNQSSQPIPPAAAAQYPPRVLHSLLTSAAAARPLPGPGWTLPSSAMLSQLAQVQPPRSRSLLNPRGFYTSASRQSGCSITTVHSLGSCSCRCRGQSTAQHSSGVAAVMWQQRTQIRAASRARSLAVTMGMKTGLHVSPQCHHCHDLCSTVLQDGATGPACCCSLHDMQPTQELTRLCQQLPASLAVPCQPGILQVQQKKHVTPAHS